jgi:hypothetical protein
MIKRKRQRRVSTLLNSNELALLRGVRKYVKGYTGISTTAEALRYLIRNWMP